MATLIDNLRTASAALFQTGHNVLSGTYSADIGVAPVDIDTLRLQSVSTELNTTKSGQFEKGDLILIVPPGEIELNTPEGEITINGTTYQIIDLLSSTPLCRKYRICDIQYRSIRQVDELD